MKARLTATLVAIFLMFSLIGLWGNDKPEFRAGRVVKFESSSGIGDAPSVWSRNIVTVQDGSEQYSAGYVVHVLGHHPKDLVVGQDIGYRVSGNHLLLKKAEGKQIKAEMCKVRMVAGRQATVCAGETSFPN